MCKENGFQIVSRSFRVHSRNSATEFNQEVFGRMLYGRVT